jgi:hypothetical protein
MKRMARTLISLAFTLAICLSARAQELQPPAREIAHCPNAWNLTGEDTKWTDGGDAWTSDTASRDGVLSLTYCNVFKTGRTTVKRIPTKVLGEIPGGFEPHVKYGKLVGEDIKVEKLPPGFTVYRGAAFEITTAAVPRMLEIAVRVPSVQSEEEFKRLYILYLDENFLLPGSLQWHYAPATMLKTDFKTKTLGAGFDYASVFHHATNIGRVVVASFSKEESERNSTNLYIDSVVSPPYVKNGENFTYSVTIYNGSGGTAPATDVVFNSSMNNGEFVSASASQGRCRKSVNSDPVVVCELGTLAATKKVVINITVKARGSGMMDYRGGEEAFLTSNIVIARENDYSPENNSYESRSTVIRR